MPIKSASEQIFNDNRLRKKQMLTLDPITITVVLLLYWFASHYATFVLEINFFLLFPFLGQAEQV